MLYNILIGFIIAIRILRLIKMCVNDSYIKVHVDKVLGEAFPITSGMSLGDAL
jgi:hypothetical protein